MRQQSALTQAQQRRLEKLAREAGRTTQSMLGWVLQDGFDYCEYVVRSANEGIQSLERDVPLSTAEALRSARAALSKHGARIRKAA